MTTTIMSTALPAHHVLTIKQDNPFALRPYWTFIVGDSSARDFATIAAALHEHARLVRELTEPGAVAVNDCSRTYGYLVKDRTSKGST